MYTSIRAHFENGQVIFDEPVQAENGTELIVTILPSSNTSKHENSASLKEMLLNAPTWSDNEYNDFMERKDWMKGSRLSK